MLNALDAPRKYSVIERRRFKTALKGKSRGAERDTPARVLIVEDNADIRTMMKLILEDAGIQVTALGDGQSASELIENWPAPDLVVMDRMLPLVSGDVLIQRIRADSEWSEVPVVVVSAKARGSEVAEVMFDGANDYVTKPFNTKYFVETIGRYL